jgi:hypothetical protein
MAGRCCSIPFTWCNGDPNEITRPSGLLYLQFCARSHLRHDLTYTSLRSSSARSR